MISSEEAYRLDPQTGQFADRDGVRYTLLPAEFATRIVAEHATMRALLELVLARRRAIKSEDDGTTTSYASDFSTGEMAAIEKTIGGMHPGD